MSVIVPTLAADAALEECALSLAAQTMRDFELIVVDNSGAGRAATLKTVREMARIIDNPQNVGFGAAVNQGIRASSAPFVAVLNDDASAHPDWLARMLDAAESHYEIGMCAPQVRFHREPRIDSAGMLIARDGSSKQRGHGEPPGKYPRRGQALLPSGCAALYRRDMLDEIGLFDEHFFLYCEDTDLGLRARWNLWECEYVPEAVVEHRYSHSSGPASPLKAFYVERNRLFLVLKNFPAAQLAAVPFYSAVRFFWHAFYLVQGHGKAAEFSRSQAPAKLPLLLVKAWLAVIPALPRLWKERRLIRRRARATPGQFARLLASYRISLRQVAAL